MMRIGLAARKVEAREPREAFAEHLGALGDVGGGSPGAYVIAWSVTPTLHQSVTKTGKHCVVTRSSGIHTGTLNARQFFFGFDNQNDPIVWDFDSVTRLV